MAGVSGAPALVVGEGPPGLDCVRLAVDDDGFDVLAGDLQVPRQHGVLDERGEIPARTPSPSRSLPAGAAGAVSVRSLSPSASSRVCCSALRVSQTGGVGLPGGPGADVDPVHRDAGQQLDTALFLGRQDAGGGRSGAASRPATPTGSTPGR